MFRLAQTLFRHHRAADPDPDDTIDLTEPDSGAGYGIMTPELAELAR